MGKYFGTDGVRGEANVELTPELAFKLGRFGGYVLSQHETGRPKVFVARDTRISGEMLESALVAGLLSVGIEVYKLGVLATPGVSYLVRTENASAGVMISASHNPALDNGIKFFGGDGFKLDDAREAEIEALLDAAEDTLPRPSAEGLGTLVDYPEGLRKYEKFLVATGVDLGGMKVALDAANGAATSHSPPSHIGPFSSPHTLCWKVGMEGSGAKMLHWVSPAQPSSLPIQRISGTVPPKTMMSGWCALIVSRARSY